MTCPFLSPNAVFDGRWAARVHSACHRRNLNARPARISAGALFYWVSGSSASVAVQRNSRTMRGRVNEEPAPVDGSDRAGVDHAVEARARVPKGAPTTIQILATTVRFGPAVPPCARGRITGAHVVVAGVGLRAFATVQPPKLHGISLIEGTGTPVEDSATLGAVRRACASTSAHTPVCRTVHYNAQPRIITLVVGPAAAAAGRAATSVIDDTARRWSAAHPCCCSTTYTSAVCHIASTVARPCDNPWPATYSALVVRCRASTHTSTVIHVARAVASASSDPRATAH